MSQSDHERSPSPGGGRRRLAFALAVVAGLALVACPRGAPRTSGATSSDGTREVLSDRFTDDQLVLLLRAFGYDAELVDAGSITFAFEVGRVMLFNQWEGDLQLYYVMTGGDWRPGEINEWNRTRRLTRAYLDTDGDLVLESDLLSLAGLTERQVGSFIAVFGRALQLFVTEVASKGIERPVEELPDPPPPGAYH